MIQTAEPVEAVIISGPRRGEIVQLHDGEIEETEISDEDIQLLNNALDDLIAAIDRLSAQVRSTTIALGGQQEAQ